MEVIECNYICRCPVAVWHFYVYRFILWTIVAYFKGIVLFYAVIPQIFINVYPNQVCNFIKNLYGLIKQANMQRFAKFFTSLISQEYRASASKVCE